MFKMINYSMKDVHLLIYDRCLIIVIKIILICMINFVIGSVTICSVEMVMGETNTFYNGKR